MPDADLNLFAIPRPASICAHHPLTNYLGSRLRYPGYRSVYTVPEAGLLPDQGPRRDHCGELWIALMSKQDIVGMIADRAAESDGGPLSGLHGFDM
jgi:hypothetical protein